MATDEHGDCPKCGEPLDTEDECWGCGWPEGDMDIVHALASKPPTVLLGQDSYGRTLVL
jgi:hypothetical protein